MTFRFTNTILLLVISISLFSQSFDEKDFTYYGYKQGLSDNYVSGILQDSNGYIWVSTRRGLNRFDGKTFKQFLHNDKYNAIPDNAVYSMHLLNNEQLAIATDDGVQVISTKTLERINLSIADDQELRYWSNACRFVAKDADGNYGVSTKTGFYIFSSSGQIKKRFDYYTRKDIGNAWMLFGDDLTLLPDGNIMQHNQDGVLMYDRQKNQIYDALLKYPALKAIKEKDNSLFFSVSKNELVHINIETNTFDFIDIQKGKVISSPSCIDFFTNIGWWTNPAKINDSTWAVNCKTKGFFLITLDPVKKTFSCYPKRYFADKTCPFIFNDRSNNLWIGTNEGLFKQNSHPKIIETFSLENEELKGSSISALYISNDKIFVGTEKNKILILDKHSKKLLGSTQLSINKSLTNYVRTFLLFHPDTLWVGTSSGLFWVNMRNYTSGKIEFYKDPQNPSIFSLFADSKKNIWMSTYAGNSIYFYNSKTRLFTLIDEWKEPLFKTNVTSIAEDKDGNIWMAGDAIIRWNFKKQKIDTLIQHLPTQQNFKRGYYVMADSKGDIWAAITDDGIAKLTGNSIHLRSKNLTQEKSSFMSPVLLNDKIFIFTAQGSGYFDINTSKSIAFTNYDGIPQGPASTFFFVNDLSDGSTWFAVKNVICKIPAQPEMNYLQSPILNITALSILNDTNLNYPSKKVKLNYEQGDVNIFYSAINYTDPENMRFAYRIKNKKDSSWIDAGDQQNILLTNISPGNYKIELKVSAFDNKWIEQIKELEIEVKPPFWETPVFIAIMLASLATIVYYLYRNRISQVKQKANIDKQLAQTEMKALHAQMNPHFIFNCLNSIREMILNNENEQASLYLSKFARLIRITLNQSSKQFVTLTDTIDYLERYIEMEKIRSNHFTYKIDTDKDLQTDEIMMPPMLIQPFIENAIWHGTPYKKKMHINISFHKNTESLICRVEDDGIGINESIKKKENLPNEQSVGIANIKQRINLLNEKYNLHSTIKIEDKSTLSTGNVTGTIVLLHLPIKTNESLWTT